MAQSANASGSIKKLRKSYCQNENHTEKLKELRKLQKDHPEKLLGFRSICMCIDDKFKIGTRREGTERYIGLTKEQRETAVTRVVNHVYKRRQTEVQTLVDLCHHPNIVDFWFTEEDKTHHYIATELCDYNIREWVKKKEVTALELKDWIKEAASLVKGLLTGLDYMHTLKPTSILHRDIKPENMFVVSANGNVHIKMADFDLSLAIQPDESGGNASNTGTNFWRSKEVLDQMYDKNVLDQMNDEEGDKKTSIRYRASDDVQSAGMVCFFIMSRGIHPYAADGHVNMIHHRVRKGMHDLAQVEEEDPVACDLVKRMLAHDPLHRPSAGELLSNPYLWDGERRYKFLTAVGSLNEVERSHNHQKDPLVTAIEATKPRVLPSKPLSDESVPALKPPYWDGDWEGLSIVPMLKKSKASGIGKPGYMQSVCKLLRQIRNCDAHDLDPDIRTELGDSRYEYFNGNFPQLFMEVYGVIKSNDTWIRERKMREFFPKAEDILEVTESNKDLKKQLGDVNTKVKADIALLRGGQSKTHTAEEQQPAEKAKDKSDTDVKVIEDKPLPPRNLQVLENFGDYILVAWQAPAKDGNSPITGYVVETADADANEITFTAAGDTNSNTLRLKVSHLVTGKHYRVRVFAKYAIGQSEPVCLDEPVLLPSVPLDKPSRPRNVHVVKTGIDYICLEWEAPQSDGNSPITGYVVEKADANKGTYTTAGRTNCDTLEFKLSHLDKEKLYLVQVIAENANGQSAPACIQGPISLQTSTGEKSGACTETLFRNTEVDRFNKTHTDLLKELQQKKDEEFVQGLPQIRMCIDKKFCIGKGHDGTEVYIGLLCDGRKAAVKRMENHQYNFIRKEVEMLVTLKHDNILSYMVTENDKSHHYIATELCDYTIREWVKKKEVIALELKVWIKEAASLVKGLLTGLNYMHTLKNGQILHRDIKPRNVFVVVSTSGEKFIKIADFDLSRRLQPGQSTVYSKSIGTQYWFPRELLDQMDKEENEEENEEKNEEELKYKYKPSGDIQSAGMVCFFIMSRGTHPYAADRKFVLAHHRIMNGEHDLAKVEKEDPVACDLVKHMLAHDQQNRPSAGELLSHPYLWKEVDRHDFLPSVGRLDEIKQSHDYREHPLVKAIEATVSPPLDRDQEPPAENPVCSLLMKILESGDLDDKYHESKWFMKVYRVIESNDGWSQRPNMKRFFPPPKTTQETEAAAAASTGPATT